MTLRILGIDPGLRTTGYGAIVRGVHGCRLLEAGVVSPNADLPLESRLAALFDGVDAVLTATTPDVMVVEELWTAYKHPMTAVLMGHARGVLCLAAQRHGVHVEHLAHSLVKRALVGSGAARKEQVKRMVMQQLGLRVTPQPNDVSDALALALAFANIEQTRTRLEAVGLRAVR